MATHHHTTTAQPPITGDLSGDLPTEWIVSELNFDTQARRTFVFDDKGYRERVSMNSFFHHPIKVHGLPRFRSQNGPLLYTITHRGQALQLEQFAVVHLPARRNELKDPMLGHDLPAIREGRAIVCDGLFDFYKRIGYNRATQKFNR